MATRIRVPVRTIISVAMTVFRLASSASGQSDSFLEEQKKLVKSNPILVYKLQSPRNMIGRQSQNEGIVVLPAPASGVKIDGDLSDWDWSGRIACFADESIRSRFSVEVAAMWDKQNLYVAAKWKDSTPMYSTVDPEFNPNDGWKSDSLQVRLRTTDRISHVTTWYYAPKDEPCVHIDYGKGVTQPFGGTGAFWVGKPGSTEIGRGIELAYRKDADGKGYAQELKLPWSLVCGTVPDWKAGDTIQMGLEFLWGDVTGKTWPIHRYADNMQPGKSSREFYFTNYANWGDAKLLDHGNVPLREYVSDTSKIEGSLPISANLPKDAARFTMVVEDSSGHRVRNLAADCNPDDYALGNADPNSPGRWIEVRWDCRDDHGTLVAPGTYHVRGLTQRGLSAEFESYFYNPGTPPWQTPDGSGAWGADHSGPNNVAASGDWTLITCPVVEGGSGLFGIDPSGRKMFGGEKRGFAKITADEQYAYGYVGWGIAKNVLCRLGARDGSYHPFILNGQARPFDLPLADVFGGNAPGTVNAMAVSKTTLALAMSGNKVALLDKTSAALLKTIDVPTPTGVAYDRNERLYVWTDGKLALVDPEKGSLTPIATPGVGSAVAITCDAAGNVLIADTGPDSQVKSFCPSGQLVYTCGKQGGRPVRGIFDEQAMMHMSSVAADAKGQVWVTEDWNYPRRVSVWGRDGKLVRDYIGNTGYAGTDCYLHDTDPDVAFCGPMEFHRDAFAPGGWKLGEIMWVPDRSKGETFALFTDSNNLPQRFTSNVGGSPHEYLYVHEQREDMTAHVIYMKGASGWKPVSAIAMAGYMFGEVEHGGKVIRQPDGPLAGFNAFDIIFWNDRNKDGAVGRDECERIAAAEPGTEARRGRPAFDLFNGWGGRIAPDLTIYTNGLAKIRPDKIDADGAPSYSPAGRSTLGIADNGDIVPLADEHKILLLSFKNYAKETTGMLGLDDSDGRILWSYPNRYPGVHGSHDAPMAAPGLLIGPLKICGVAKVNDEIGNVFVLRGNLGQDFFFTTDGLYVGALFRDGRLPAQDFPATLEQVKGMPMEEFSEGGEPFNGWFGKQSDGQIRFTTGMAREAGSILHIGGLDTIKRFDAGQIKVDDAALAIAKQQNSASSVSAAAPKVYTVHRIAKPMTIDGDSADWSGVAPLPIAKAGATDRAEARLAYDAKNLYVLFEVTDSSPWKNAGKDFTRLFKTGDAVDLQLGSASDGTIGTDPKAGDLRVVLANFNGKPTAVLMMPVDKSAPPALHVSYTSPVGTKPFDRVEMLADAEAAVKVGDGRYTVEAAIPLAALHLSPSSGLKLRGDLGFISSDASGLINVARTYWSNQSTNLVNDLPIEAWFSPAVWGEIDFE